MPPALKLCSLRIKALLVAATMTHVAIPSSPLFAAGPCYPAGLFASITSISNEPIPELPQFEAILFPRQIIESNRDCAEMARAGLDCMSFIPSPVLDTTLIKFARHSAELTSSSKTFLDRVGTVLASRRDSFSKVTIIRYVRSTRSGEAERSGAAKYAEVIKAYLLSGYGPLKLETRFEACGDPKVRVGKPTEIGRHTTFIVTLPDGHE